MTVGGRRFRLVAVVVLAHVGVNLAHGLPHGGVPVPLAVWQNSFVAVVVIGTPLAGLWLLRRGRRQASAAALIAGGVGSTVFGTYSHFVSATPDNVARVTGDWSGVFLVTAGAISLLGLATALVGARLFVGSRRAGR